MCCIEKIVKPIITKRALLNTTIEGINSSLLRTIKLVKSRKDENRIVWNLTDSLL